MARLENQTMPLHFRAVPIMASASKIGQAINSSAGVLHSILISSHTALTFRLWNSATGPANPIGSTYTPAAGSQVINFSIPIEFSNGIWMTHAPNTAFDLNDVNSSGLVFNIN